MNGEIKENTSGEKNTNSLPSSGSNTENDNQLYESIKEFFGGPYRDGKNVIQDISYTTWVEQDINIKRLCSPFEVILPDDYNYINQNNINNNSNSNDIFGVLSRHDYGCELKLIKWITEDETHKNNFIKVGNKGEKINRHNDILPYAFNAVPLDLNVREKNLGNYINASYIDGPIKDESKLFIATQGPLKDTIPSFWKMIYNHKIKLVVMLSSNSEEIDGRSPVYWPKEKEKPLIFKESNITVEFVCKEILIDNAIFLKKFKINNDLEVKQMHVVCWPDHCMPADQNLTNVLFDMMLNIIKLERNEIKKAPVVVHCSAGVGRTGTLISIYLIVLCMEYIQKLNKPLIMNVFNVVRKLREQRYSLVTDTDQYKYIYDYSLYWIKNNYLNK